MDKIMEQIDKEIYGDNLIDDLMMSCWKDMVKKNKELDDKLVEEITKSDPEWVKNRRLEYLKLRIDELNKEYISQYKYIQGYRNKVDKKYNLGLHCIYNLFADMMENEKNKNKKSFGSYKLPWRRKEIKILRFLQDIIKDIKDINDEINLWDNPKSGELIDDGTFTDAEIEMARKADPGMFLEFERNDGERHWIKCPFHDEDTASFCYYESTNRCYCFSCGWGGNTVDLVMKLHNTDFRSAVELILNKK